MSGFSPLAATLRNLFLRKASLWPRFHVTVAKSLEGRKRAEVIELEVPMTDSMRDIQSAVLECVEVSISELKKANSGLEMDDWNVDTALHKSFDVIIRRQLDSVWHRVSWRTKQIVNDLTVLRQILQLVFASLDWPYERELILKQATYSHTTPSRSINISIPYWLLTLPRLGRRGRHSLLGCSSMQRTLYLTPAGGACTQEKQLVVHQRARPMLSPTHCGLCSRSNQNGRIWRKCWTKSNGTLISTPSSATTPTARFSSCVPTRLRAGS